MARDIQNKIVVITGAAEGIGFNIAANFVKNGAKRVIILDINENLGREAMTNLNTAYGEKVDFLKCDVTQDLDIVSKVIFDKYKKVDVLVNNAGTLNEFDLKKTMDVNVIALIKWSIKFSEHMRTDKGGKGGTILNIASIYGYRRDPFSPIYKASKHAVMGYTKTTGHEYHFNKTGVRVVAICPGYTRTSLGNLEKLVAPDETVQKDLLEFLNSPDALWQTADAVGEAAVKIFKIAESGTAWQIEGGRPIEEVQY